MRLLGLLRHVVSSYSNRSAPLSSLGAAFRYTVNQQQPQLHQERLQLHQALRLFSSDRGSYAFDDNDFGGNQDRDTGRYQNNRGGFRGGRGNNRGGFRNRDNTDFGDNLKKVDWESTQLGSFEKNFYVEHKDVTNLPESEVEEFYSKHNINVVRGERMRPLKTFAHANFPRKVETHLQAWPEPTSIQAMGWPLALSGQNMVAIAQTGSGKTLGFILPALVHIKHQPQVKSGGGPVAIVLAPTRELAIQIESVASEMGRLMGVHTVTIYGGADKAGQMRKLSMGPELIIATPGRLTDFISMGVLTLRHTTFTVLDEADRMLDMGFEPQIRKILNQVRPDRQMLMWSATWPKEIQNLARDFLGKDFTQVNVGSGELTANPDIEQLFKFCEPGEKLDLLLDEVDATKLDTGKTPKTIVFCQTKSQCDYIERRLYKMRIRARAIHGDKTQNTRETILSNFKNGRTDVMIATDVAARGIDVSDIDLVINYDFPNDTDSYIHRIGRTGRAGKKGKAICYLTDEDANHAKDLITVLKKVGQEVPSKLQQMAIQGKKTFGKKKGGFGNNRGGYRDNNRGFGGYSRGGNSRQSGYGNDDWW